jgi:uncharacterized protein YecT (DUF1311 family)
MIKKLPILLILAAIAISCAKPEEDLTPCDALTQADREMLSLVEQIEAEFQNDKEFITAFKNSQIYWTQYRNRQVKAVYPKSPKKYDFDVGACKCELIREMTELRIKELRKWTDGIPESQCAGSYKTKGS